MDKLYYAARNKERREAGLCLECNSPAMPGFSLCTKHQCRQARGRRTRHEKGRNAFLDLLGGQCVRCGVDDKRVLQLDHVNGDDRTFKPGSWAEKEEYQQHILANPNEYQVLCANCHVLKTREGNEYNKRRRIEDCE